MPQSNRAMDRIMRPEKAPYLEDWPEKQECRDMLMQSVEKPPTIGFSLCGMEARCVMQWRKTWKQMRIVCVDKAATAARFTQAHNHPRQIGKKIIPNQIFSITLKKYADRQMP